MKTIYADVVFFENFIIDYLMLSLSSQSMYLYIKQVRLLICAAIGGVYALLISIVNCNMISAFVLNFLFLFVLCAITLGKRKVEVYIRFYLTMYVFSFLLCGFVSMLPEAGAFVELVRMPVLLLLFVIFIRRVPEKFVLKSGKQCVESQIMISQNTLNLTLVRDSGNLLRDPYTKLPVIFVNEEIISKEELEKTPVRPVPFKTVSGSGIVWVFTPCTVKLRVSDKWHNVKATVGICKGKQNNISLYDGIVPAVLVENL